MDVREAKIKTSRILIHVEGITEETFVNEILRNHLFHYGYTDVSARLVGNARLRTYRGGIRGWNTVRRDILNHLKEDSSCVATTLVDYYGLPQTNEKAWPGRKDASSKPFSQKASIIENALLNDICTELGSSFNQNRFIPFIVMHEFEGLLFSDCDRFAVGIGHEELAAKFQNIRNQFGTPEEINDSPNTAPSKRVLTLLPDYQKPFHGTLASIEVGLEAIRASCPHFNNWLSRLETINN